MLSQFVMCHCNEDRRIWVTHHIHERPLQCHSQLRLFPSRYGRGLQFTPLIYSFYSFNIIWFSVFLSLLVGKWLTTEGLVLPCFFLCSLSEWMQCHAKIKLKPSERREAHISHQALTLFFNPPCVAKQFLTTHCKIHKFHSAMLNPQGHYYSFHY